MEFFGIIFYIIIIAIFVKAKDDLGMEILKKEL